MQASYCCILQPDQAARALGSSPGVRFQPNAVRWMTTHADNRYAAWEPMAGADLTEMFQGGEYLSFGGRDVLAMSGDDKH